ncbi:hypothetical protein TGRUB_257755 [Toxoplasma gondii RUB]|uniref:Uncharacterized protein n=5 Tax=Toxoplasma gondii TaxID=5811 RepID=S7UZ52_TOXGG|nr:hypothetical protein TGGT1_257755 [Toxoplasma gondii GT1]KAF4641406.1 hypothetical protein TGRH88_072160 [Toxoplasma gondii]KFG50323.1 hypothetical protein TGP89_257755 [Toxoplasma gondii p89]KFG65040.1 hypothetical protein TGRUB_257755 [Toxoplasma gondii RUB]KFH00867.1 hypothetical protein TGVAND_257755 [Toxoplasma gondii VAND]
MSVAAQHQSLRKQLVTFDAHVPRVSRKGGGRRCVCFTFQREEGVLRERCRHNQKPQRLRTTGAPASGRRARATGSRVRTGLVVPFIANRRRRCWVSVLTSTARGSKSDLARMLGFVLVRRADHNECQLAFAPETRKVASCPPAHNNDGRGAVTNATPRHLL